ncbi:MAG: phosphatase PAP2 family protein [Rhodopila sp.]|jgi:membrane-associated phospholipid phosphatase
MGPLGLPVASIPAHAVAVRSAWRQRRLTGVRRWAMWFVLSAVAILLCIAFVDHPVVLFMREHPILSSRGHRLSFLPVSILAAASASVVVIGTIRAFRGEVPLFWRRVLFAGLACCVALTLKTEAKYLLGRIGPGEWYWHQTPPFLDFHLFHRDGSFPSGHMTAMWSIAPFVWVRYPWLRIPWILASLGVGYALVAAKSHFVSDLIGGCLLGGTVGYLFLLAAERPRRHGDGVQS